MKSLIRFVNVSHIFRIFIIIFILFIALFSVWLFRLNQNIQSRISGGWFRPPVEIYARGDRIFRGQKLSSQDFIDLLQSLRFRQRFEEQTLYARDFSILDANQCDEILSESFSDPSTRCVYFQTEKQPEPLPAQSSSLFLVKFNAEDEVSQVYSGQPLREQTAIELTPQLFAQFYGEEPIMRTLIKVGDAPLQCLQAVTAIEDSDFLVHKGVSFTGLVRALVRNIRVGRYAQGGSTITQQLVKNYFLSPEKTLKRKFSELMMAILLEANTDKDQILENYLNIVYMGQRGPFQVIGLGSASEHYFSKPLGDLGLAECALLAALINSPGRYNPFTNSEQALARRNLVLERMVETEMIDQNEAQIAKNEALPKNSKLRLTEPAPYFTQAINRELIKLGVSTENGLKIFTTLDIAAQDYAQKKVLQHVKDLESNNKKIKTLKAAGKNLEASLISVDVATGEVLALVGGRQYVKTQYNRILDAHRQVGSVMKPFVYLTALESRTADGRPYTALTPIEDVAFSHRYEGQTWSPKNYTNRFYGTVPLFYALKNSLNSATASLGLQIGLDNVVEVAKRAGITSQISALPSLTLGAFELYPWEVATAMLTIARFGNHTELSFIRSIHTLDDEIIYQHQPESETVFAPETVAVLVGMMKQTMQTGTGRLARLLGFTNPAAGKTGTTSDSKDAWFVGYTPHLMTVTWTGYDDNTPSGLTGASGALPLWAQFMKSYLAQHPEDDFNWPNNIKKKSLSPAEYKDLIPFAEPYELEAPTELIEQ